MPDLPEIETYRRDLERDVSGKKIKTVEVASMKCLPQFRNKKDFVDQIVDAKVQSVTRRGLSLLFTLDNELAMVVDLGPTGGLRRRANKEAAEKGTEITWIFTQHGQLRYIDPDQTGEIILVPTEELATARPEWAELGTDTVDEPISWTAFGRALLERSDRVKLLLMDPTFLVGLGQIYSDEILFHAGLRYNRTPDSLSTQEIRRLYRAVVEVVHDAVKYRGTTLEDNGYADLFGEPGVYQDHLAVYGKAGEMSPRARGEIVRSKIGGQWTYYCEQTQA